MNFPKKVVISESSLRDGLQNEKVILTIEQKLELINDLIDAGFSDIEAGSFVRGDRVPSMANSAEVFQRLDYNKNVKYYALAPNLRGLENAIGAGAKLVGVGVSASTAHNLANYNRTPEESLKSYSEIINTARAAGIEMRSSIQMAFGSPWERRIPLEHVKSLINIFLGYGIKTIIICDTAGVAVPNQVYEMFSDFNRCYPGINWILHLHNTRGAAMSNMLAAMQAGVTCFAASLAGLGGCPFVPNAAGNLCTEDAVHLLEEMGIETGLDLDKVIAVARKLEGFLGHKGRSYILEAGKSSDLLNSVKKQC